MTGPPNKAPSQRDCVLDVLKQNGATGVPNIELNRVCFRYGARMYELRRMGYTIRTENLGDGCFRFVLEYQPSQPKPLAAFERRTRELEVEKMPLFASLRGQG